VRTWISTEDGVRERANGKTPKHGDRMIAGGMSVGQLMPSGIGNEVVAVDDIEEEVSQAASPRVEAKLEPSFPTFP
jgi:hypothetical protein